MIYQISICFMLSLFLTVSAELHNGDFYSDHIPFNVHGHSEQDRNGPDSFFIKDKEELYPGFPGESERQRRSTDAEGMEVLNRINRIMANASISAESKRNLEAAIGSMGTFSPGSSGGGGVMSKSIPFLRRRIITGWSRPRPTLTPALHATKCCCKVSVPPLTQQKARQVTRWRQATRTVRAGNRKCGFLGWKRCTRWRTESYRVSYLATEYYVHYTPRSCPRAKEVCCRGFVGYKACCTNIQELKRLLELFERQREQFDNDVRRFLISQGHNPDAGCPKSCGPR